MKEVKEIIVEIFKPIYINGEKTIYSISDRGRVVNTKRRHEISQSFDDYGYLKVSLYYSGGRRTRTVHRLAMESFYPKEEWDETVNHIDGDKTNNCLSNLEWCSMSYNIHHAFNTGLKHARRGEASNFSKYTEDEIRKVCQLLQDGIKRKTVSKMTNFPYLYIADLVSGSKWSHITSQYKLPPKRKSPSKKLK